MAAEASRRFVVVIEISSLNGLGIFWLIGLRCNLLAARTRFATSAG